MSKKTVWVAIHAATGEYLGRVHPGQARKLMRNRHAYTYRKAPYAIRLVPHVPLSSIVIHPSAYPDDFGQL
ncbi:hypothetical protein ACJU26_09200 [Acidithiobacillus sp. M4-SHS-6]|uniref:hypothetical protein n=1 Tax=Acidithiobacillus sp. M4-SHS-6 TaxID=3383024 RepID=UPI0039BEBEC6